MGLNERSMNGRINSEIHASLRRLEDANNVSIEIQANNLSSIVDQANAANSALQSQINAVVTDANKLNDYITPHIKDGDLCLFQTIYAGNLQVDEGASIGGPVTFSGVVSFDEAIMVNDDLDLTGSIIAGEDSFGPHSLTIEGQNVGTVLSADDINFSLVGSVKGTWSNNKLSLVTVSSGTNLFSTTLEVTPTIAYDPKGHQYFVAAYVMDEKKVVRFQCSPEGTGTKAYEAGISEGQSNIVVRAHISYNETTHTYEATAEAVNSTNNKVIKSAVPKTSGTEAYDAGRPDYSVNLAYYGTAPGNGYLYYSQYDHGQSWTVYWD